MLIRKIEVKQKVIFINIDVQYSIDDNMAKPIAPTPIFDEQDVEDLKEYMTAINSTRKKSSMNV